ncbi:MAG TPA: ABC transporter substrate-binding protein [Pseudomonas sp.]|uniref:ABC transporter substrate-binding protein n=1 Tax=Pseudomonas sp. TaxID=306 RepID=UPI002B47870C|nr:ABC transporter substrate-binding protein [Pseudomonas sp.]HKS13494.1 ABC transporter substrate-binding protein [Pseudomonas sp.]
MKPVGWWLAMVVLGLLGGCEKPPEKTAANGAPDLSGVVLRVGAPNKIGSKPYLEAAGQLKDVPYQIEWSEFSATPALLESLRSGHIDLGGNGGATGIIFEAGNGNADGVKVIASGRPLDATQEDGSAALLVRADSPYRSMTDLKGARVSVMRGSGTQYLLGQVLDKAHLGFNDIQLLNLTNDAALAALVSGHIDAWGIWDPQLTALLRSRSDVRLLGWVGTRGDSYAIQYVSTQSLADPLKSAAIEDFLKRLARSTVAVGTNPEQWAALSARQVRVDVPVMKEIAERTKTRYGLDEEQQRNLEAAFAREADYWLAQGVIQQRPDIGQLFDLRFNAAMREATGQQVSKEATQAVSKAP